MTLPGDWRRRLAAACLLVFAAVSVRSFHWRSLPWRFDGARSWGRAPSEELRVKGTGFGFDPSYAIFLEAVRAATPEDAAVSIVAPKEPDTYVYQAAFTLAPRRVVGPGEAAVVPYVAFYREDRALTLPRARRIPGGVLIRR